MKPVSTLMAPGKQSVKATITFYLVESTRKIAEERTGSLRGNWEAQLSVLVERSGPHVASWAKIFTLPLLCGLGKFA